MGNFLMLQNDRLNGPQSHWTDWKEVEPCEALDQATIAELTSDLIYEMSRVELVRVIRAGGIVNLLSRSLQERLCFYDLETLRRLAFVARNCCQHKLFRSVT